MIELVGKVAVVVGAANGLGRACASALARQGMDVVLADMDGSLSERVVHELGHLGTPSRVISLPTDVRSDRQVRLLARDAVAAMGRVDVVVNAAGVLLHGRLDRIATKDWEWMLEANLLGAVRMAQAFLPRLVRAGSGHIVNTVPIGALLPRDAQSIPYDSGFAAVAAFTQGLRAELAGTGVTASILCPGRRGPRIGQSTRSRGFGRFLEPKRGDESPQHVAAEVAGALVDAIRQPSFLVLADPHERRALLELRPDLAAL